MKPAYEPARAWGMASMLFVFMAINAVDKITVGLLAVPIMESMHLTPAQFGVLASSFFWLFAVSGIVGGFIANRVPTTVMLLCMCAMWSVVQIPMMFSASLVMFIAARMLLGMAEGPAFPVAVHACYKWFPDHKRDLPVSLLSQGGVVGLLFAGMTIPLVSAYWGWRANFMVAAIAGIVWAILWRLFSKEGPLDRARTDDGRRAQDRVPYRKLITDPTLVCGFLMHFVAYWSLALSLTWLPPYLQSALGYPAVDAGRLYAAMIALAVPITIGTSWLARRLLALGMSSRAARGRLSGLTLMLAGTLLIVLWKVELAPAWRMVLIALALGLTPAVYSLVPAMIGEVVPASQRGAMLAMDNSLASLAGIVAPVITGYMIHGAGHAAGYEAAFGLSGVLLMGGGAIGAWLANPAKSAAALRARLPGAPFRMARITVTD
ncbi:putative sulfoacetate transporter SauU [Cupriavidus laharis]|uniref:Sulfoacetate transporter SauU n=1 Tax=Cupriavidus laharis TaxID=151654 RepID=A0ABN7Y6U6_9BURK|nr:MFS transporter [Cupriavidus laharis]CAG9169114.1 putative sulfoacetate transporter SauU [Cupriavidus laharis]